VGSPKLLGNALKSKYNIGEWKKKMSNSGQTINIWKHGHFKAYLVSPNDCLATWQHGPDNLTM
jgi:hypothetical protein